MIYPFLFALSLACSGKDPSSDTSSENDTSSSQDSPGDTDTQEPADPNAPSVTEADAWCYTQGGSTNVDYWAFSATVTDPQGVDTVESFMTEGISFELAANGSQVKTITGLRPIRCMYRFRVHGYGRVGRIQAQIIRRHLRTDADGNASAIHHSMP